MSTLLVTRSVLSTLVRQPLWWLCAALLAASWPALRTILPLGLSTADLHHWTAAYELAFLGGIVAILGGMGPLARLDWILGKAGAVHRTVIEAATLVSCAAAIGAFILVPAHLFDVWQFTEFRAGESFAALLLGWAHVATIAAVSLRLPLDMAPRVALVLLATCLIPGLLVGDTPAAGLTLAVLDVGGTLRASFDLPLSLAHWIAASVPILAWGAAAVALASPPDPRPAPAHALRDPR